MTYTSQWTSGPTVIVVHGGPGRDHRYLLHSKAWDHLGADCRLVLYDQRGCGESVPVEAPYVYGFESALEDLGSVVAFVGESPVILLGHS